MKKYKSLLIIAILSIIFIESSLVVYARAGGYVGGSGDYSSSSGGGINYRQWRKYGLYGNSNILSTCIIICISFFIIVFSIIFPRRKLILARIKSKKKIKKLKWNYNEIKERVKKVYFVIQNSWANGDMNQAIDYMEPGILDRFKFKLNQMKYENKKNILKNIKLLRAYPILLIDDEDESKCKIFMAIHGKMIDYIVDTQSDKIKDGNNIISKSFLEFWQFSKNSDGKWILSNVYQKNDFDYIMKENK